MAFIFVFFVAILLITYVANKNGMGSNSNYIFENNNSLIITYKEYEAIVKERAISYQEQNYPFIADGDTFYININRFDLPEKIKNSCDGYAKIGKENEVFIYEPYLKCGSYITSGYVDGLSE